jgi:hypothetical protein
MIEEEMLIIRPQGRINSKLLHQRLEEMDARVRNNDDYRRTPSNRPPSSKSQEPMPAVFKELRPRPRRELNVDQ